MNNLDAAIVARVASNLRSYNKKVAKRELHLNDYPAWSGLLAVNLEEVLAVVEKLSRPEVDGLERELASGYVGRHESGTGWPGGAA